MKKVVCILLSCLLIALTASGAFAVVYGEEGWEFEGITEDTAWEINSVEVLKKVRDDIASGKVNYVGYYKLTKDLDLTNETAWEGIGTYSSKPFKGHFNGNGHTIKINIEKRSSDESTTFFIGLFQYVDNGTIKNLSVKGNISVTLIGNGSACYAGGIVAVVDDSTIENCTFDGNINTSSAKYKTHSGGIAAQEERSSILNCKVGSKSSTLIKAQSGGDTYYAYEGGIAAYVKGGTIKNNLIKVTLGGLCSYSGNIYGRTDYYYKPSLGENTIVDPSEPYDDDDDDDDETEDLELSASMKTSGTVDKSYSGTATVTGGTSPYTWKKSGTLPTGLKLTYNSAKTKATLSGTPTEAGTFKFTLKVTDSKSNTASKTFTITIADAVTKPTLSGTVSNGIIKAEYAKKTFKVTGGTSPYTWTKSGTLPTGLTLTYNSAKTQAYLSGTPTKAGTFTFKLTAKDSNGASVSKSFTITITKPTISGTVSNGTVGTSYTKTTFKVTGGTAPYTWTKSGTLPTGLKLTSNSTGTQAYLSGTPTKAGTFTFKLTAKDSNGASVSQSFTITIKAAAKLRIVGRFRDGTLDEIEELEGAYSDTIKVSGGTSPYKWTKTSGTLPTGLKLQTTSKGVTLRLTGEPSKAGTFTFTVKATDSNGLSLSKELTVVIEEAIEEEYDDDDYDFIDLASRKSKDSQTYETFKNGVVIPETELKILSDDILSQGEGKYDDLFEVKAEQPLTFIIGEWVNIDGSIVKVSSLDIDVYVDEKLVEDIEISDEGTFTLPAEFVKDDFKVQAKAYVGENELETQELFIGAVK